MCHSGTMLELCTELFWAEGSHTPDTGLSVCVCVRACSKLCEERGGKRESLNVTLLSTVTTLTTCDVSAHIIIAH